LAIYLHEIIHVVPGREEPYMAAVLASGAYEVLSPGEVAAYDQVGLFRTTGTSGRWSKVINLWEGRDWKQFAHNLSLQFTERRDPYLEDWWNRNLTLRRGGFDRMLVPAAFSPDLATLTARGVKGRVFLHEILHVRHGEARAYLQRFEQDFLPAAVRRGWQLIGAYRVAMRPREVLTLWGMQEWSALSDLLAGRADPELSPWFAYRDSAVTCSEEMVLLPGRINPLRLPE
jgi:hypothetical protein